MVHALAAALALVVLAANSPPPSADAAPADTPSTPAPNSAIVRGHHIQPKANQGQEGPGFSKRDADDVDRLYQELMRQTVPDTAHANASTTPQ
jgi:hypothetical protein